jgi:hypothetical protein
MGQGNFRMRPLDKREWIKISGRIEAGIGPLIMLERLLDSVILIDHFNNIPQATTFISGLERGRTAVSALSYEEILVGFEDEDQRRQKPY